MRCHTNAVVTKNRKGIIMYRLDIFARKRDGNRGPLKTSSWYPDEPSANKAKRTLIKLSNTRVFAPVDAQASEILYKGKLKAKIFKLGNCIIADPVEDKKY